MKKKLLYLLIVGVSFLHININGMFGAYQLDQQQAKQLIVFKDGVSFAEKEKSIRTKYSNIPDILLLNRMVDAAGNNVEALAVFEYTNILGRIWVNQSVVPKYSSQAFEWVILHETGHAQKPYNLLAISISTAAIIPLIIGYYWGMHKSTPYANLFTKLGSKACAAIVVGFIANSILMQTEERRADNWANKQADKDALLGGFEYLSSFQEQLYNEWSQDALSSIMPFKIAEYLIDPIHPSLDSRIAKIKTELKTRFSIDV